MSMYLKFSLSTEQYFHQDVARGRDAAFLGTVYNFPKRFGLKSGDWNGLSRVLCKKNTQDSAKARYAVIFLARHGQGYHNVGEEYVGGEVWKSPSALSPETAVHHFFPDTRLTPVGQHQANTLSSTFRQFLEDDLNGLPWPQKFYVSPLHRALDTSYRTWAPLSADIGYRTQQEDDYCKRRYEPIIIEALREQLYIQECNKRSTKSEMKSFTFDFPTRISSKTTRQSSSDTSRASPSTNEEEHSHTGGECRTFNQIFRFHAPHSNKEFESENDKNLGLVRAQSLTENDDAYQHQVTSVGRDESNAEVTRRAYQALNTIVEDVLPNFCSSSQPAGSRQVGDDDDNNDNNNNDDDSADIKNEEMQPKYISITTHAGLMSGIYRVLGLTDDQIPRFPTGIVIPVVIKIEKVAFPPAESGFPTPEAGTASNLVSGIGFKHGYEHGHEYNQANINGNDKNHHNDENDENDDTKGKAKQKSVVQIDQHQHHRLVHPKSEEMQSVIKGKSLDDILTEIRDQKTYEKLIRKFDVARQKSRERLATESSLTKPDRISPRSLMDRAGYRVSNRPSTSSTTAAVGLDRGTHDNGTGTGIDTGVDALSQASLESQVHGGQSCGDDGDKYGKVDGDAGNAVEELTLIEKCIIRALI